MMDLRQRLALRHALDQSKRDPLSTFKFMSWAQQRLAEKCGEYEVYWRSGNLGAKTLGGAALGVALARGEETLAGVKLPQLGTPNDGWVLSRTYKQQVFSVQAAYLAMIGDYPHATSYENRGKNYISTIRIKPRGCPSNDPADWSTITFISQENKDVALGARLAWAHADEPPVESVWREMRKNRRAGKPYVKFITATPLNMDEWYWLLQDFPIGIAGENGRYEIQSSVYDNKALSAAEIAQLENEYKNDPLKDARLKGAYVDVSGKCPFSMSILDRWGKKCEPGTLKMFNVLTEKDTLKGRVITPVTAQVEVWEEPNENEEYFVVCDPSTGIEDKDHDPSGIHVWARRNPRLVARYGGYIAPFGLGVLAAQLATRYRRALVDVDCTGGYGASVLSALQHQRYHNVNFDLRPDRPGKFRTVLGFTIDAQNRSEIIGALQQALLEDSCTIWSKEVIACLMQTVMDPAGKVLAGPGRHDEDLILAGRFLDWNRRNPAKRYRPKDERGTMRQAFNRSNGNRPRPDDAIVENW